MMNLDVSAIFAVAATCMLSACGDRSVARVPSGASVEVETPAGPLRGVATKDLRVFLGVPFAEAPTGKARFAAPAPRARFESTFDASHYGPICPQLGRQTSDEPIADDAEVSGSEDCLNLNVFSHADEKARPVMVFIHGGGFQQGSGSKPQHEGSTLARGADVVVVTINYRLGSLGLLALEELAVESPDKIAGNYSFLDQIAALEWVKTNIASLGGDPSNVTIFGESAGAISVCVLAASPRAKGLFHRAIIQSSTECGDTPGLRAPSPTGRRSGVTRGTEIAEAAGCGAAPDKLACLRALDAAALVRAGARAAQKSEMIELFYTPVVDGVVLPEPIPERLTKGVDDVPIIVGSNSDESSIFLLKDPGEVADAAAYEARIRTLFGGRALNVLAVYPANLETSPTLTLKRVLTEVMFTCPNFELAAAAAAGDQPSYAYVFDHRKSGRIGERLGAFHGIELAYLFGLLSDQLKPSDDDREVGRIMRLAWGSFAKSGRPESSPAWPGFDPSKPAIFNIAAAPSVLSEVAGGRCAKLGALK